MNIDPATEIVILEAGLVAVALICVIALTMLINKLRDKKAAESFVKVVQSKEQADRVALATLLKNTYHFDEDKAKAMALEIKTKEFDLYKAIIGMYLRRQPKVLENLESQMSLVTESYRALIRWSGAGNPSVSNAPTEGTGSVQDQVEIERLRSENAMLLDRLLQLEKDMDQSSKEFMATYKAGVSGKKPAPNANTARPADDVPTLANKVAGPVTGAPAHDKIGALGPQGPLAPGVDVDAAWSEAELLMQSAQENK